MRAIIRFVIARNGSVVRTKVEGVAPPLAACIVEQMRHIEFPAPNDLVDVTYPLVFRPLEQRPSFVF